MVGVFREIYCLTSECAFSFQNSEDILVIR